MLINDAATAITKKFENMFLSARKVFRNTKGDPSAIKSPFVRLVITFGAGKHIGWRGNEKLIEKLGEINFEIFTIFGKGDKYLTIIADQLGDEFSIKEFGCIQTLVDDGPWPLGEINGFDQAKMSVPFTVKNLTE